MYYATGRYANGQLQLVKKHDEVKAQFSNYQNQYSKYHFESTLNYERLFGTDHRVSALAYYYMSSEKNLQDIADADSNFKTMAAIPKRYQGISSRVTYGFRDTYLMDLNIVKEKLPWLDHLKLRGSYGLVGNDRITSKRFPYLTIVDSGASLGWGGNVGGGISESVIGADNLEWEKSKKLDIGIEGKLFDNKIDFVVDYFFDKREGIFQQRAQIPNYVGLVNLPYGNVGQMKSWGADGNISYTQQINKDMSFVIRGNFTYSKNKIDNWEQIEQKYAYQNFSGWPYGIQRGYIALGLFRDEADINNSPIQTFGIYEAGDIKYKDVNGDGKINADDRTPISRDPDFTLSLNTTLKWKGFDFYMDWYGVSGRKIRNGYLSESNSGGSLQGKLNGVKVNYWTPFNPSNEFPRPSHNTNVTYHGSLAIQDASYIRLRTLQLGYTFPTTWIKKLQLQKLRVYATATNLLTFTDFLSYSPELTPGAYPESKQYVFGINVSF